MKNSDHKNLPKEEKALLDFLKVVDPDRHTLLKSFLESDGLSDKKKDGISQKFTLIAGIDVRFNSKTKASEYKIWLWYLRNRNTPK